MKKAISYVLLILSVLLLVSCRDTGTNPVDNDIYLSGMVRDVNGNPISDAAVYLVFDWQYENFLHGSRDPVVVTAMQCDCYPNQMSFSWTTQSETNLLGFNILRGDPDQNQVINPQVIAATNTSSPSTYNYNHPEAYAGGDYWLKIIGMDNATQLAGPFQINTTLPVEMSSFTAVETVTHNIQLDWVTQSETGLEGFHVLRNTTDDLDGASVVSTSMIAATNTSQEQHYRYIDDISEGGTYYYWLQVVEVNGSSSFYGYVACTVQDVNPPVIPTVYDAYVYPNPSPDYFILKCSLREDCNLLVTISCELPQADITVVNEPVVAGVHAIMWHGTNNNGDYVSNGRYTMVIKATNSASVILYEKTIYLFKNGDSLTSLPVVATTSNGYSINMSKFCQWDKVFEIRNDNAEVLGTGLPGNQFWINVSKEGYQTATRYINLTEWTSLTEDFVLQPAK